MSETVAVKVAETDSERIAWTKTEIQAVSMFSS